MATVKPSALVSSISGKVGGIIFQKTSDTQVLKSVSTKSLQKTVTRINAGWQLTYYNKLWREMSSDLRTAWESTAQNYNKMYKAYGVHSYNGRELCFQYWSRVNQGIYGVVFPDIIPSLQSTPVSGVQNIDYYAGGPVILTTYNDYLPFNQWLYISVQHIQSITNRKTMGRKRYVVPLPVISDTMNIWPFLPPGANFGGSGTWVSIQIYNVVLGQWYSLVQTTVLQTL